MAWLCQPAQGMTWQSMYAKMMAEVGTYADEGAKLMIKNEWMLLQDKLTSLRMGIP